MPKRFWVVSVAIAAVLVVSGCTSVSGMPQPATNTTNARPAAAAPTISPTLSPGSDRGPETGAKGTVIDEAAGDPSTYVVASGDTLSNIADRFGITIDELTTSSGSHGALQPGEKLTLNR